jgi:hypothetical protein
MYKIFSPDYPVFERAWLNYVHDLTDDADFTVYWQRQFGQYPRIISDRQGYLLEFDSPADLTVWLLRNSG